MFEFALPFTPKISARLLAAPVTGGLIGLERSYHGRPAGFGTRMQAATEVGRYWICRDPLSRA